MKIVPLSEGAFTIDKTKVFVPFEAKTDDLQKRSVGSLLVEVQPFVVITEKDILLIDTGLGFSKNGILQIHSNLRNEGIEPKDITKVLMSHLHKDHAGGIGVKDRLGNVTLAFSNATYYLQKKELDYALDVGFPSYIIDELSILSDNDSVELLDGDGVIDGYIEYKVSGGHSPYHQEFFIKENDEIIFFGGDNAPQLQQMKSRFSAKYDYDGKKSMELRQVWWQQGQKEGWKFLFYHDIKTFMYPVS